MKHMPFLSPFLFISLFLSCKVPSSPDQGPVSLLLRCWTNAFEEQTDNGLQIYRLCDSQEFPAARYRNKFTLMEKGEAEYQMLSPSDAHYLERGNWSYDEKTKVLLIRNHDNELIHQYRVEELWADKLVLKEN